MSRLAIGDQITVVERLGHSLLLAQTHVSRVFSARLFGIVTANNGAIGWLCYRDEGVIWIRGQHTEATDEGKALLVANALTSGYGWDD